MELKKSLGVVAINNLRACIEGQEDEGRKNKALNKSKNAKAPLSEPLEGLSVLTVGILLSKKVKSRDKNI